MITCPAFTANQSDFHGSDIMYHYSQIFWGDVHPVELIRCFPGAVLGGKEGSESLNRVCLVCAAGCSCTRLEVVWWSTWPLQHGKSDCKIKPEPNSVLAPVSNLLKNLGLRFVPMRRYSYWNMKTGELKTIQGLKKLKKWRLLRSDDGNSLAPGWISNCDSLLM